MGKCLICSLVFIPILAVLAFFLCQTVVIQNQTSIEISGDVNAVANFWSSLDNMLKLEIFEAYEVVNESSSEKVIDGEDTVETSTVIQTLVTVKVLGKTHIKYTREIYTTSSGVFHIWSTSNLLGKVEFTLIFKPSAEGNTVVEAKHVAQVPRILHCFVDQYMTEYENKLLGNSKVIFEGTPQS